MASCWPEVEVRFVRGGGGIWEPQYSRLDREWFRKNLIDYDFWYVSHGKGVLNRAGESPIALHPGVCLWMRPGSDFEAIRLPGHELGTRFFHFELYDTSGRPVKPSQIQEIPLTCKVEDVGYFDTLTRRMVDLIHMGPLLSDPVTLADSWRSVNALLRSLLMEYVLSWRIQNSPIGGNHTQNHLRMVSRAMAWLRANPGQADLTRMIESSGYCDDHYRRVFKRISGQTLHRALITARIDRARDLLETSKLSVGAIAQQLGYPSVQHFSVQFKQQTGQSPSEFRRRFSTAPA
jgi:AraC-like DNA-binding protein